MGVSLAEALEQVNLEPGRTYRCQVGEHWVELRVLPAADLPPASPVDVENFMMDPWVALPTPAGTGVLLRATPGTQIPVDVPYIPSEENEE